MWIWKLREVKDSPFRNFPGAYLEPCQTYVMGRFNRKTQLISQKTSIIDVWQAPMYASGFHKWLRELTQEIRGNLNSPFWKIIE